MASINQTTIRSANIVQATCDLPPYTKPLSVAQPKPPLAATLSQGLPVV